MSLYALTTKIQQVKISREHSNNQHGC